MNKVGIVIVNYNGEKFQNDCVRSLYEMENCSFEIIVVDSCSSDNSINLLKKSFPKVHVLEQSENVGVAVGNNIGIEYSKKLGMQYTLLLNNDVVLDKKMLCTMLEKADEKVVVVPKIYYYKPNNVLWYAGGEMDWYKGNVIHYGLDKIDNKQYDIEAFVTYAPTCCMLISNVLLDKVGKIDEKVFMYFDDTDLCVRLQEVGAKILYVPSAIMWHKVSSSSGGSKSKVMVYYFTRNHLYFMNKYKHKIRFPALIYTYTKDLAKFLLWPILNNNYKYIKNAYSDFKSNNMGRKDIWE